MDRRPEFTALLKTLKRRVGKQSSATQQPEQGGRNGNSRIILESATAVRDDVHGLHTYLVQNASDYVGANRHTTTEGFDSNRCDVFDTQAAAKLRACADALAALKIKAPKQEAVAQWQWDTPFEDAKAMHSAAVVASVARYLDQVATFYKRLALTRAASVETVGRLSLPSPLKPTLRRPPPRSLGQTAEEHNQLEDSQVVEDARLSQRGARRAVEQSKKIELVVLDPLERAALQCELRLELEVMESELVAAVRTVDKLAARHARGKLRSADTNLAEAATRLSTSLRRDLSQLKSALDRSPLRRHKLHLKDSSGTAAAAGNMGGNKGKKKRSGTGKAPASGDEIALHRGREARITASLKGAVDNPSYSGSLTSKQLDTEQASLMAQKAREDDLSVALLSARQKLQAIAEQRTKLAQHVVTQNETLLRTLKDTADAKDDITSGNDEVKKATSSQNDMRWGVVFFLLMCSACLLFLEWEGRR
eukprot:gene19515-3897_t